jgi:hypothetical protein
MRSVGGQVTTIAGPERRRLLFAIQPEIVYIAGAALLVAAALLVLGVTARIERVGPRPPRCTASSRAPIHPRDTDDPRRDHAGLFAVLRGCCGAAPLFARDILHTGPFGLGGCGATAVGPHRGLRLPASRSAAKDGPCSSSSGRSAP